MAIKVTELKIKAGYEIGREPGCVKCVSNDKYPGKPDLCGRCRKHGFLVSDTGHCLDMVERK